MAANKDLMEQRADLALSDFSAQDGLLAPEQAKVFIDYITEEDTILKQARTIRMKAPSMLINRMGFGSRVLHKAPQGTSPYAADDGTNDRYLAAASRAKPTFGKLKLEVNEKIAEVHIPYEALEDNIEGMAFEEHVMRLLAKQVALDLEEWMLQSDTDSGDTDLATIDGLLKLATSNVVDLSAQTDVDGNALNSQVHPGTFASAMLTMPQKYLRNLSALRHFLPVADVIKYRSRVAQRATGYGDSVLTADQQLSVHGVKVEQAPLMPSGRGFFTYPQNILFGIFRDISVETDKDIRSREIIIVLTLRVDTLWDTEDAVVAFKNIGA